ncbi:MAG: DinB family protein [Deltaproteobacteria bacterium]|nr:DinB family protein [Deltaproteobacteria bacterium]
MFEVKAPVDREELLTDLRHLHQEIWSAMDFMDPAVFLAPQGEFWSPADHMRHLVRSIRPIERALSWPKLVLGMRFGRSKRDSMSFEQVREKYSIQLAAGAKAGSYGPSPRDPSIPDSDWRALVLRRFEAVSRDFDKTLTGWTDKDLERYQLPHPLLGDLSIKEMLLFTLYHSHHHARRIFERLSPSS